MNDEQMGKVIEEQLKKIEFLDAQLQNFEKNGNSLSLMLNEK